MARCSRRPAAPWCRLLLLRRGLLLAATGGATAPGAELGQSSRLGPEAEAHFCRFDCSGSGRPSKPGTCFRAVQVYQTDDSWLLIRTRDSTMLPGFRHVLPEWLTFTSGNMTWEGWFRMMAPPEATTTLFGTYGANHDQTIQPYNYQDGTSRRRQGSVAVDVGGGLTLTTNLGRSSGSVAGAVGLQDGNWHHVAAVFSDSGGAQIGIHFRIKWVGYSSLLNRASIEQDVRVGLQETLANVAGSGTEMEDIFLTLADGTRLLSPTNSEYALLVQALINTPTAVMPARVAELSVAERLASAVTAAVQGVPHIDSVVSAEFSVQDIKAEISDVSLPVVYPTGSAQLYVDGFAGTGSLTYVKTDEMGEEDNIGMDGEFVIGGGRLGITMGCQVAHFRFWSVALSPSELKQVRQCTLPQLSQLIGGPPPYNLTLSYDLDGSYDNSAADSPFSQAAPGFLRYSQDGIMGITLMDTGLFVKGGPCNYERCPMKSPDSGCPLAPKSEVKFWSKETCDEFAALRFCREVGPSRGRPPRSLLQGCHAGGPTSVWERPLSRRGAANETG